MANVEKTHKIIKFGRVDEFVMSYFALTLIVFGQEG